MALTDEFPNLDDAGYEIDVRPNPNEQVGGDIYSISQNPNGSTGGIIDPAALSALDNLYSNTDGDPSQQDILVTYAQSVNGNVQDPSFVTGANTALGFNVANPGDQQLPGNTGSIIENTTSTSDRIPQFINIEGVGLVPIPAAVDASDLSFERVNPTPIDRANFNFTEPIDFLSSLGDNNVDRFQQTFDLSRSLGSQQVQDDVDSITQTAPQIAALARDLAAGDSAALQQQRLANFGSALPEFQTGIQSSLRIADSLSQGVLPSSVEDRLFELNNRSAAADSTRASGLGLNSPASRRVGDLFSAQQRLGLINQGTALRANTLNQGTALVQDPVQINTGGQIPTLPSLASNNTNTQNAQLAPLNTLLPATGLSANIGQEQFVTDNIFRTDTFNSQRRDQADFFNSEQALNVDLQKLFIELANVQSLVNAFGAATNLSLAGQAQG